METQRNKEAIDALLKSFDDAATRPGNPRVRAGCRAASRRRRKISAGRRWLPCSFASPISMNRGVGKRDRRCIR
ncbi:hypothetical protein CF642_37760 [Burkholderia pseudomallei]|nr:hypothetical protein CF642_37760 [Burkholderia pseudomallei]